MASLPLLSDQYVVEEVPAGLRVTLPVGRRRTVAVATVALLLWLLIEVLGFHYLTGIYPLQAREARAEAFPPQGFLVLWTLLGLGLLAMFLWQVLGETVVQVAAEDIRIHRRVLGLGPVRTYRRPYIHNLRAEQVVGYRTYMPDRRRSTHGPVPRSTYQVAFDYGLKVVRLGGHMDAEEAARLVSAIAARFPEYGGSACSTR